MKRLIVLAVVVVALLGLFVGTVQWRVHSDHPESLVRRLRKAKNQEQRERLIMKLNLSKKDPVGPLLKALETSDKDPNFRMGILEILFKRQLHAPEDRIKAVLGKSLEDADVVLRRKATELFATYVVSLDSRALAERIHDTDSEVRRHAYEVFASNWYTYRGAWVDLVEGENDKRKELVEECRNRMTTEKDPDLRFMARAIVGRQIWDMCRKARETLQGGDIVEAEDLLNKALELDPENHRARIRMVRHHLMTGNKEKALTLADQHGALLRIPVLASAPVVNGDPTEQAWHDAFTSDRFYLTLSAFTGKPAQGKSQFHIGHYEGKIYVAVLGYEDNLDELVIKHTQRDSAV